MVHFVMDDRKDLQGPRDAQSSICVVIITVRLLHVHMLEIVQLMCDIGLCSDHVWIPKALQLLAFGAPDKFVSSSFCNNVFAKVCFLDCIQF